MEQKQAPYKTGLLVNNSLNQEKEKEEFVPMNGRQIRLYNCGPTVYDSSHMGHARTYISVDMIRRILTKYFGYDLFFAMNITDIDDKIIIRSNEKQEEFSSFARKWENDFWSDMEYLGVEYPDALVRVSEHVPEIVKFIQQIIDNGYAYESNGSVYFDVAKFMDAPNHYYAKLEPMKVRGSDQKDAEEQNSDKRNPKDFALWKKSKPGEPKWQSQWSEGRPGWHIECSAMADSVLGYPIDIHMGGEDLKFPHHDNEIAQTEAYYNKPTKEENQWVNYFIHTGHLNIDGLKMSKSLKNFITIKNLMRHFSARQIRILFALHQYDSIMDYSPHTEDEKGNLIDPRSMREPMDKDRYYVNFFRTVTAVMRQNDIKSSVQKWDEQEFKLNEALMQAQQNIHKHLLNNFNSKGVILEIDNLIKQTNIYMEQKSIKNPLLNKVVQYVKKMFEVIGLDFEDRQVKSGSEENFLNDIKALSTFRDEVRMYARADKQFDKIVESSEAARKVAEQSKSEASEVFKNYVEGILKAGQEKNFKEIMDLCDKVRDQDLPQLGIKIDDRSDGPSLWKQEDKDVLMKEIEEKKQQKLAAEQKKREQKLKKQQEEEAQMKINPAEMFLKDPKYSKFDENGMPILDKDGKELSKKQLAYCKKEYEKQAKKYDQYLSSQKK